MLTVCGIGREQNIIFFRNQLVDSLSLSLPVFVINLQTFMQLPAIVIVNLVSDKRHLIRFVLICLVQILSFLEDISLLHICSYSRLISF